MAITYKNITELEDLNTSLKNDDVLLVARKFGSGVNTGYLTYKTMYQNISSEIYYNALCSKFNIVQDIDQIGGTNENDSVPGLGVINSVKGLIQDLSNGYFKLGTQLNTSNPLSVNSNISCNGLYYNAQDQDIDDIDDNQVVTKIQVNSMISSSAEGIRHGLSEKRFQSNDDHSTLDTNYRSTRYKILSTKSTENDYQNNSLYETQANSEITILPKTVERYPIYHYFDRDAFVIISNYRPNSTDKITNIMHMFNIYGETFTKPTSKTTTEQVHIEQEQFGINLKHNLARSWNALSGNNIYIGRASNCDITMSLNVKAGTVLGFWNGTLKQYSNGYRRFQVDSTLSNYNQNFAFVKSNFLSGDIITIQEFF